jgi:phage terminase large subunit
MNFAVEIPIEVFNPVYRSYLRAPNRIQIFFGGSSSGKSVFLAQRTIFDLLNGGRNYLIVRNVGNTLRHSVFNELTKVISEWGLSKAFSVNKSEMTITCRNGYQAILKGLDDPEKIKSITPKKGVITDIWNEEATESLEDTVRQLRRRLRGKSGVPKRITFSFNPIMRTHWINQRHFSGVFGDDDRVYDDGKLLILRTTYLDNLFLEDDDREELENETDPYWRDVYTLGKWGVLGDLIFKNWETADLSRKRRTFDKFRNGLDFGFTNDPTACVRSHYDKPRKTLYILQEVYRREMTNPEIAAAIKPMVRKEPVVCDSAEPKSIKELKGYGIRAIPAKKGKDSVHHGIQFLKQLRIVIDKRCQNTINEFQQYQWRKDKDGNALNEPLDKNNNAIDAIRYAHEDEFRTRIISGAKVITRGG